MKSEDTSEHCKTVAETYTARGSMMPKRIIGHVGKTDRMTISCVSKSGDVAFVSRVLVCEQIFFQEIRTGFRIHDLLLK